MDGGGWIITWQIMAMRQFRMRRRDQKVIIIRATFKSRKEMGVMEVMEDSVGRLLMLEKSSDGRVGQ